MCVWGGDREGPIILGYHSSGDVPLGGVFMYLFECVHHGDLGPSETLDQNESSTSSMDNCQLFS